MASTETHVLDKSMQFQKTSMATNWIAQCASSIVSACPAILFPPRDHFPLRPAWMVHSQGRSAANAISGGAEEVVPHVPPCEESIWLSAADLEPPAGLEPATC